MGEGDAGRIPDGRLPARLVGPWRAVPGDLLGAGASWLAGASASRRVDVVTDDGAVLCTAVVVEDRRLGRWLDLVPLSPVAMTFGRYVLARRPLDEGTLRHELEHVRQWSRLGPLFLPAYLLDSLVVRVLGGDRYRDNRFEIAARAREAAPPPATGGPAPSAAAGAGEA